MDIKIKLNSIDFLEIFNIVRSESWDDFSNKIRLKVIDNNLNFYMIVNNILLRSKSDIIEKTEGEFNVVIEVNTLYSLIKNLPKDSIITFRYTVEPENRCSIVINENEKYSLEVLKADELIIDDFFDNGKTESNFELKNPAQLALAETFKGNEKVSLDSVGFYKNKFYASDTQLGCILETSGNSDEIIYIPSKLLAIFKLYKKEDDKKFVIQQKTLNNVEFYYYRFDNVELVITESNSKLPDLTSGQFAELCNMETEAIVDIDSLSEILLRMNIVTKKNPLSRIYITFEKDQLVIENRWNNKSKAILPIENILKVHGHDVAVSCKGLTRIISCLEGRKAYFKYDPESVILLVQDESRKNLFFHVALFKE